MLPSNEKKNNNVLYNKTVDIFKNPPIKKIEVSLIELL